MKDWTAEAAREIDEMGSSDESAGWVRDMIIKHCPFKPDVAYMPVPRCDSCKHWTPHGNGYGDCPTVQNDHGTSADFGCTQWEAK